MNVSARCRNQVFDLRRVFERLQSDMDVVRDRANKFSHSDPSW